MQAPLIALYGIPNCDTVRKARAWCDTHSLAYEFHDFKKKGIADETLQVWLQALGPDALVNKRGTTWRQLDVDTQTAAANPDQLPAILQTHPSLIKRPIVDWGNRAQPRFTAGFEAALWKAQMESRPT